MKSFNRSIVGKTINFIIVNICAIVFVAALFGLYMASECDVYTRSEETVLGELLGRNISWDIYEVIRENVTGNRNCEADGFDYTMTDSKGKVVGKSANTVARQDYVCYYDVVVRSDSEVDISEVDSFDSECSGKIYKVAVEFSDAYRGSDDEVLIMREYLHALYIVKDWLLVIVLTSVIVGLVSFALLMEAAGRKGKTEEPAPGIFNFIPLDLLLIVVGIAVVGVIALWSEIMDTGLNMFTAVSSVFLWLFCFNACLGMLMTCASRIKQHTLIKNTVCFKILHFFWTLFINIPCIWKTILVVAAVLFLQLFVMIVSFAGADGTGFVVFTLFMDMIIVPVVLYTAVMLSKLQKAGCDIAEGNVRKKVDTTGLFGDFKRHAENLNSISDGMSLAIEQEIKSDRMKTELITNVSHDLKTPLTSIINYADLIANEPCENENIIEYSGILVKQSDRLKRLIEDLVEASKASTGNLEVNMEPCNPAVFLSQAGGEYEEKLAASNLVLVTKQPEEEVTIMADPRRMWRIFDNLMNNICKYSLEGSRVYLSMAVMGNRAVMTFKNTSKEPLDISEEELMERFVRGDSSRNTEGNGLGLSIAKSLAELQNGVLSISIDGDLFKAVLSFPIVNENM